MKDCVTWQLPITNHLALYYSGRRKARYFDLLANHKCKWIYPTIGINDKLVIHLE